jgi:hypothetical protein
MRAAADLHGVMIFTAVGGCFRAAGRGWVADLPEEGAGVQVRAVPTAGQMAQHCGNTMTPPPSVGSVVVR